MDTDAFLNTKAKMQAQPVLIGGMNLDVRVGAMRESISYIEICSSSTEEQRGAHTEFRLQAAPATPYTTQPGGTVPGQITLTSGGVARNIAQCLGTLLK